MKYTKYREYLERTARELKGEPEVNDWDKWGDRLIVVAILLLPLYLIVRSLV